MQRRSPRHLPPATCSNESERASSAPSSADAQRGRILRLPRCVSNEPRCGRQPRKMMSEAWPEPFAGWFARRGWVPRAHQLALLAAALEIGRERIAAGAGGGFPFGRDRGPTCRGAGNGAVGARASAAGPPGGAAAVTARPPRSPPRRAACCSIPPARCSGLGKACWQWWICISSRARCRPSAAAGPCRLGTAGAHSIGWEGCCAGIGRAWRR